MRNIFCFHETELHNGTWWDYIPGWTIKRICLSICFIRLAHHLASKGLEVSNAIEDEDNSLAMATKRTSPDHKGGRNEERAASSPYSPSEDRRQISPKAKDMKEEHSWETAEDPSKKKEESRRTNNQQELKELFNRLNLPGRDDDKLSTLDVLKIDSCQPNGPKVEGEVAHTFLNLLFMMNYRARYIAIKDDNNENNESSPKNVKCRQNENVFATLFNKKDLVNEGAKKQSQIHPMDVQMAVFHSADPFLRQSLMTKLSMCQYALPLLVPDPFTSEIELPLWAFRQVWKSWKSTDKLGTVTAHNEPMYGVETPMVSVFRLGPLSTSKSQLINSLIGERHSTFFHRHCPGSSKTRLLMDGVVEIAWYCPSGKDSDHFPECVAICNLHGDGKACRMQQSVLSEMASVNVAFLPRLSETGTSMAIVEELFSSPTPLICLLNEDDSLLEEVGKGKFKMGLRDRNQSDIVQELKKAINEGLSLRKPEKFRLGNLTMQSGIKVDEDNRDCRTGEEVAQQIKHLLEGKFAVKESVLPCQGKLWHEWCLKNKELYRLHGNAETQKSLIEQKMGSLRIKQLKAGRSKLMEVFLRAVDLLPSLSRTYFLKWTSIYMDSCTSDELVRLHHEYNEKWSKVLVLKKKHDKSDQLKEEQTKLENISDQLNAATFGLEHILREMGQIYEAAASVRSGGDQSKLPAMAAELMISGHPLELMDGDAGQVPLIWIEAVLDEVIKKIEDKRIFVLSILGIQSTGKSTMLNAMFGLQFAVSAGRCTRGAFMQLIRVTKEIKAQFDYILVVDTEGLRALELAGRATMHHDNELATFVIGLGHMTLINIFGENPAEMQDILQIAVQAFLRMKKVKLSPSCVFVHQNVGDITAGEKNMEGKRRLQEKLDEMTQLAAKEEDSDAQSFSDVIAFDIQKDVKYFAQLWEGSPPMAPPNPCYSESVQDLKKTILSKASKSKGMKISEFKTSISDLWNALLNENFVFSFKNTLEIAVYKKLETEFVKWTWALRKAMLLIENELYYTIESGDLDTIEHGFLLAKISLTYETVKKTTGQYFDEHTDKDMLVQWRGNFESKISDVHKDLVTSTQRKMNDLIQQKKMRKTVDDMKVIYEKTLFQRSKELALSLKEKEKKEECAKSEKDLEEDFDQMWKSLLKGLTIGLPRVKDCNIWEDVIRILSEDHEESVLRQTFPTDLTTLGDFNKYVKFGEPERESKQVKKGKESSVLSFGNLTEQCRKLKDHLMKGLTAEQQDSIKLLIGKIHRDVEKIIKKRSDLNLGYNKSYIQEIADSVRRSVRDSEQTFMRVGFTFKRIFTVHLLLSECNVARKTFTELHKRFQKDNDVFIYLKEQRDHYYKVFKDFCQGAQSCAVLGNFICSKLKVAIKEAVYNQTAIDLADEMQSNCKEFNGNRSKLEGHILLSLAKEENFDQFMKYIHNPLEHFKSFITEQVNKYKETAEGPKLETNLNLKTNCARVAAQTATAEVKDKRGDANMWLKHFSDKLKGKLIFEKPCADASDITDFDFLQEVVCSGLDKTEQELSKSFRQPSLFQTEQFQKRTNEILIDLLCKCCWVQCPFCKAICTNTVEGHKGQHSVLFHRTNGLNGWHFRGTTTLCADFCTTAVASDGTFYPSHDSHEVFPYKEYTKAGKTYADWSITPDNSELPYWKWFMCRFKDDLEKHYNKTFQGNIPEDWSKYKIDQAEMSLDKFT